MTIHIPLALRHKRFFYLWLGLMISIAGSQMQVWALFWHIRTLTDQPIALDGIGLALIARKWPQLRTYNGDEPILAGATAD